MLKYLTLIHIEGRKLMAVRGIPFWKRVQPIFISRTSGGAHIYLLLTKEGLLKFKEKWNKFYEDMRKFEEKHGRGKSFYLSYTIEDAPPDINEFFHMLREYFDLAFDYRVIKERNTVEIAVAPYVVGRFIGKKGYKVKAISKHLGMKIKVTPAIKVHLERQRKKRRMGTNLRNAKNPRMET